jgi:hypothetical protein
MRCLVLILSVLGSSALSGWQMGPPPGPNNTAICPVTGVKFNITAATPSIEFTHGQQLYFATEGAAKQYHTSPRDYWLAPHDKPLPGPDGMRGLPVRRALSIPHCGRSITSYCPSRAAAGSAGTESHLSAVERNDHRCDGNAQGGA